MKKAFTMKFKEDTTKATCSCKLAILRSNDVQPELLAAFLKSKYGQNQIQKFRRGSGQTGLILEDFDQILMPKFSNEFENNIQKLIKLSYDKLEQAQQTYSQAEEILLAEIGLKDFTPSTDPVNIKNFSDSFATSGRLDAEYYQRKYEDYINLVRSYKKGSEPVGEACIQNGLNFNPDAKTEYRYIELSNIGKSGDINGCTVNMGGELPSRARRLVHEKEVIISSIEGSLDSCALVTKEYDGALCSTGFYVLRSDKLNSETLLVLFKSDPTQNLLKQSCSGTILTAINKDEFLNIPVPLIDKTKQQQIAALIEQSFAFKKQSENLLEVAKRAVEITIEQDESAALQYIKNGLFVA
ncbi:MAG: restriction endonuclease subunit S [Nitrospirae bacterium]|nr:restriction endonuclease subunit S [Nitrospirota bacterium]